MGNAFLHGASLKYSDMVINILHPLFCQFFMMPHINLENCKIVGIVKIDILINRVFWDLKPEIILYYVIVVTSDNDQCKIPSLRRILRFQEKVSPDSSDLSSLYFSESSSFKRLFPDRQHFALRNSWCHLYNVHKILSGFV